MKFDVKFDVKFEVTREVDIDERDLEKFMDLRGIDNVEHAAAQWVRLQDSEFEAEVFSDWKTDQPVPDDFEFLYLDTLEARQKD